MGVETIEGTVQVVNDSSLLTMEMKGLNAMLLGMEHILKNIGCLVAIDWKYWLPPDFATCLDIKQTKNVRSCQREKKN